jgi:hypothetical protein
LEKLDHIVRGQLARVRNLGVAAMGHEDDVVAWSALASVFELHV